MKENDPLVWIDYRVFPEVKFIYNDKYKHKRNNCSAIGFYKLIPEAFGY